MNALEKITLLLNRLLIWIGGVFLVAMILLTCTNIFLRLVWVPVKGTFELMGFFGAITTAFALGYTQIKKGHISVDVLVLSFSDKTRRVLEVINSLICTVFFSFVAWQITRYAGILRSTGEVTETLRFAYYPFTYAVAAGCGVLALVFLTEFVKSIIPRKEGEQ
jgi:TRAP-type C4-dicarboxylate transport system permease small subunit